jgi:DNA-binding MarR family transcriptional regulator
MKTSCSKFGKCLYFTSNALARKVEKLAQESWKPVGLSPSHAYLLMAVIDVPGIQPTQLVGELQLTPSTITRLVEKLEAQKLVQRTTEGKSTNIYPTPKAKALYPKMKTCQQHFYEQYVQALGQEASARLVQDMSQVADKL